MFKLNNWFLANKLLVNFCYYWKTGLELSVVKEAHATTCIQVSSSIVAVVVQTRLLPAFGSLVKVAVVLETWLLPVFGSLIL